MPIEKGTTKQTVKIILLTENQNYIDTVCVGCAGSDRHETFHLIFFERSRGESEKSWDRHEID